MLGEPSYSWPLSFPAFEQSSGDDTFDVKVQLDDITRRFTLFRIDHTDLLATVRSLFGLEDDLALNLSWIDNENDVCSLDSAAELAACVRFAKRNGAEVLKLQGHVEERRFRDGNFADDISDSEDDFETYEKASSDVDDDSDSDSDGESPAHAGPYYTPLLSSTAIALIREMEDREMEEGLLPPSSCNLLEASWHQNSISCQTGGGGANSLHLNRAVGVQASAITHEQSIQVNLISLAQPAHHVKPRPIVFSTSTSCQATTGTCNASTLTSQTSTTCDSGTQMMAHVATLTKEAGTERTPTRTISTQYNPPAPTAVSTSTQSVETSDKESQHFASAIAGDCASVAAARRYKMVGFQSHATCIPTIATIDEEEDDDEEYVEEYAEDENEEDAYVDAPRSPYAREESDEESEGLLEREEEESGGGDAQSPDEFVLV
ncbi:hypothetical protein HKX48_008607 [Thoreauomyces humboldtii]|nr:hypothetical protein HKX48_008607 [Thoreauomyces humboldtii]